MSKWLLALLPADRTQVIRTLTLCHDMAAAGLALVAGFYLRLGEKAWQFIGTVEFWIGLAIFVALTGAITAFFGLNRGLWRYASIPDLIAILKSATLTVLVFMLVMFMFTRLDAVPRTSMVIAWAMLILLMGGTRLGYRLWRNRRTQMHSLAPTSNSVLLVGADGSAELFIKATAERPDMGYTVAAVLDDRNRRTGMRIRGVPVVGSFDELDQAMKRAKAAGRPVKSLVIARRNREYRRGMLEELIEWGASRNLELMHLPDLRGVALTPDSVSQFEPAPLRIEDLLGRPSARIETEPLRRLLNGMTVVLTGAGGSIGGQLCRNIAGYGPRRIVLLELSEYALYNIDREMRALAPQVEIVGRLADVRDRDAILAQFREWKPDLVFHAAALKHVPLVEAQPLEGMHTNVIGTRNVADAAKEIGAQAMVLVSSDKAVNPTNVMGAAKRLAELYCQSLDVDGGTRFITVRFGNVLGSTGSVVPLFEQQIRRGGPVTVTHPEISRFFMTIEEAATLVLHSTHMALESDRFRGHIHVLDMGQPIKIVDLARRMIMLSGLRPDVDIEIMYTGLRPGEKLYEELFSHGEQQVGTSCDGVLVGTPPTMESQKVLAHIREIDAALSVRSLDLAMDTLGRAVPEAVISRPKSTKTGPAKVVNLYEVRSADPTAQ